eukprot:g2216.t1
MADELADVVMATPAAKGQGEPREVSPTGKQRETVEDYKEQAERYQRARYGKSFCKDDEGEYEIKQVPTEEGHRHVDESNDVSVTFVTVVEGHRESTDAIMHAIGLVVKATMGPGAKLEGEVATRKKEKKKKKKNG